VKIYIILNYL